ncbi:unnamed protein product [Staurois parvus]|uniref:Uncharacterized protein n=1 Tax=Staurois parvus TaxID=386267 RepID=A0ABN9HHR1_9NEOB|nr:unnamed protein product [Staurois parvus]
MTRSQLVTLLTAPGDRQRGRDLCINNTYLSPVSSCTLLCMALHSRASVKHSHSTQ